MLGVRKVVRYTSASAPCVKTSRSESVKGAGSMWRGRVGFDRIEGGGEGSGVSVKGIGGGIVGVLVKAEVYWSRKAKV